MSKISPELKPENIMLVTPDSTYMESYVKADEEKRKAGVYEFPLLPDFYKLGKAEFSKYIMLLDGYRKGLNLQKGSVPFTSFWLVDGRSGIYLGQCNLRHFLNSSLMTYGGHIGYEIRPSMWGKGLGTLQLKLLLPEAVKRGFSVVRLTCLKENIPSARIIEKSGAVRVGEVVNRICGFYKPTLIYEIVLNSI